jgi:aspartate/methionine/tyrosine aminotransferase
MTTTIFEHMSGLARQHGAINLGQGFPDFGWPEDVLAAAAAAVTGASNQYPPMRGTPELRAAVASHYARQQGLALCPDHVIVTSGATEALAASLLALVEPGDEVLLFAPLYDAYLPLVRRAGGMPRIVRLDPPGWRLNEAAIEAAVGPRTRVMVVNAPHNPAGRVLDDAELDALAAVCLRHGLTAICDEVWEHVVFDGRVHQPLIARPGMAARTVKIGSAGKIFALTGWKVGWIVAEPELAESVGGMHQFLTFTTPPHLQAAVAHGLSKPPGALDAMQAVFARGRDRLAAGVTAAGYAPLPCEGTYFLIVDLAASGIGCDDVTFCERAVREAGVAAIPVSAFYADDAPRHLVRLCFAKHDDTLDRGIDRLAAARRLFV